MMKGYKAIVRSHKAALAAVRSFWRLVQKEGVSFEALVQVKTPSSITGFCRPQALL